MGMCVPVVRFTVCRPTRMAHSQMAFHILAFHCFSEVADFSCLLENFEIAIQNSNACTVVSAVFQPLQSFDQDRINFPLTNVCYNSTHDLNILFNEVWCNKS